MTTLTKTAELTAMQTLADAYPNIRERLGVSNSCVHASIAVERVLNERGHNVEAVAGDITIVIPKVKRFISTSPAAHGGVLKTGPGYELHSFVMGQDGFVDITADQFDTVDTPLVVRWDDVNFDWEFLQHHDFNPFKVPHGDVWCVESLASEQATRGAGLGMVVSWAIRNQELQVEPHPINWMAIQRLTNALREIL